LTGYAHRVHALLGKARVVDDPPAPSAEIHVWHNPLADPAQNFGIRPLGLGHKVMQCLVPCTGMKRIQPPATAQPGANPPAGADMRAKAQENGLGEAKNVHMGR